MNITVADAGHGISLPTSAPPAPGSRQRFDLYVATASRLEGQIASISKGRTKLFGLLLASLAVAAALLFVNVVAALTVAIAGMSTYLVGHYICAVHISEDTHALEEARGIIASLTRPSH